jgi:hypothetical protein
VVGEQSNYKGGRSGHVTQLRPADLNALNVSIVDALANEYLPYTRND